LARESAPETRRNFKRKEANHMRHWLAKITGWTQFALVAGNQAFGQPIHGWQGWLTTIASLAAGVGIHAASSTDGTK